MVNVKRILLPIIVMAITSAFFTLMMGYKKSPEKNNTPPNSLMVSTATVVMKDMYHLIDSQGTVKPKIDSLLMAEVNGRVIELADNFVVGGFFKQGEMMMRIDPADYETAVKTAEANLARAEASLQEEQARARVAEQEWNSSMEGVAPELYLRKPQLAREVANVRSAQASLEVAQRDLRRTVIQAPFDAMIRQKNADIGQFVSRGATLASLYGTEIAEVRLPLSDGELAYIDMPRPVGENTPIEVTLQAIIGGITHQWLAHIVRSEGVIDDRSRVTYAVAELRDPYRLNQGQSKSHPTQPLTFGRFVTAKIQGHFVDGVSIIPRHVLTRDNQILLVVDDQLQIRDLDIVRMDEDYVYVQGGLMSGDQYVNSALPNPINGMKLRVDKSSIPEKNSDQKSLDGKNLDEKNNDIAHLSL